MNEVEYLNLLIVVRRVLSARMMIEDFSKDVSLCCYSRTQMRKRPTGLWRPLCIPSPSRCAFLYFSLMILRSGSEDLGPHSTCIKFQPSPAL